MKKNTLLHRCMITPVLIASCGFWRELPQRPGFGDDGEDDGCYDNDDNYEDHDHDPDFNYHNFDDHNSDHHDQ